MLDRMNIVLEEDVRLIVHLRTVSFLGNRRPEMTYFSVNALQQEAHDKSKSAE